MVVSSDTPYNSLVMFLHLLMFDGMVSLKMVNKAISSSVSYLLGSGSYLVYSYFSSHFLPSRIIIVASPPSSTMMFGPKSPGQSKAL